MFADLVTERTRLSQLEANSDGGVLVDLRDASRVDASTFEQVRAEHPSLDEFAEAEIAMAVADQACRSPAESAIVDLELELLGEIDAA